MINLCRFLILGLCISCILLVPASNVEAGDAKRCIDLFNSVSSQVRDQHLYNRDFGSGVFVWKVSPTEFRIEPPPPPLIANSARTAQKKVGELARKNNKDGKFTVLFQGLSESEVLAFKTMLQRDARFEGDDRLSSVLLETETNETSEGNGYELFRNPAIRARDLLLRRYDWANAKVSSETSTSRTPPQELYRLTVDQSKNVENFLLRLQLKSSHMIKNRTSQIMASLAASNLKNATAEQMAHTVISGLKKSDKGITMGTLKVMAGDFIIAKND